MIYWYISNLAQIVALVVESNLSNLQIPRLDALISPINNHPDAIVLAIVEIPDRKGLWYSWLAILPDNVSVASILYDARQLNRFVNFHSIECVLISDCGRWWWRTNATTHHTVRRLYSIVVTRWTPRHRWWRVFAWHCFYAIYLSCWAFYYY